MPVEGWTSDRADTELEIWATGHSGVPSSEGTHHAELNISTDNTISQTVTVAPGSVYRWSVDHRGRDNDDTFEVLINGQVVDTLTTPAGSWVTYTGELTAAAGVTEITFALRAVDAGGRGNLVDNAGFSRIG